MRSSRGRRPASPGAGLLLVLLASGCAARAPEPLAVPSPVIAHARELRALQREVATLVAAPVLERSLVAVHVESLDRGDTLFSYNADRLVMPASNMKILTLAAAAGQLGWDYRFQTILRATGPIVDGVLQGDLLVQGTGDPSINGRDGRADRVLAAWADAVAARGIRAIAGRVVGDGRAFADADRLGAGWSWDNLAYGYASPVSGLQINEDAVLLTLTPAAAVGLPATLGVSRTDTGLVIQNDVTTSPADTEVSISLTRLPGSPALRVSGQLPLGGKIQKRTASVDSPADAFANALTTALAARGISVGLDASADPLPASSPHPIGMGFQTRPIVGTALDTVPSAVLQSRPASTTPSADEPPIAVEPSPPLRDLAVVLMKASQNLYAETLLRAMGRAGAAPATVECGKKALTEMMSEWGIPPDTFVIADGSGLSRYNLVTVRTLVRVLRHMYEDPGSRGPWVAALPVGGSDGTLEKRFRGSAAEGLVHAKTGTIAYVRALSGYVPSGDGEQLVFSIIVNNATAPGDALTMITDAIVDRLARFRR